MSLIDFHLYLDLADLFSELLAVATVFYQQDRPVFHCQVQFALMCQRHYHVQVLYVLLQPNQSFFIYVDEVRH